MDKDGQVKAKPKSTLQTIGMGAFMDLRTEYIERKNAAVAKTYPEGQANPTRGNILMMSKKEKKMKEQISQERQKRIDHNAEAIRKEEAELLKVKQILGQKAEAYDLMESGKTLDDKNGIPIKFLVDFGMKKRELEEQGVEIEGRGEGTSMEAAASVFLRGREEPPLIVHYDPSEEPGRMFGASHVALPVNNEEQRQKTMEELKRMSAETEKQRQKKKANKKVSNAKARADRERLNRLRVEKGLPPLESSGSESDTGGEEEEQTIDINDIPLPPVPGEETSSSPAVAEGHKKECIGEKPAEFKPARDWDRGKSGYKRWLEGQRDIRNEEFAPPSSYFSSSSSSDKKRKRRY